MKVRMLAVGDAVSTLGLIGARDVNLGILSVRVQGRTHQAL